MLIPQPEQDPFLIYKDGDHLRQAVGGVQLTGKKIFNEAYVVQNAQAYFEVMVKLIQNKGRLDDATLRKETMFYDNTIIDSVRIIICFENIFKACLLSKGFVVHIVEKGKEYSILRNKQFEQPIRIDEIPSGNVEDVLTNKTIGFKLFYEPGYMEQLQSHISPGIFATLIKLNKVRNQLHFYHEWGVSYDFSPQFSDELADLIEFVNGGPYFLENQS